MPKTITVEDVMEHIYKSGVADGRKQVTRGWKHHYDLLINPHIQEEEDAMICEINDSKPSRP